MKSVFIKKYWEEGNITFYIHYVDGWAVKQVEVSTEGVRRLSTELPELDESMLSDQPLDESDFDATDFITEAEFEAVWNTPI